jgi:DNA modification methylase
VRVDKQIGLESSPEQYVAKLVDVFREVRRVLRKDGTLWLNIGDSYNGSGGAGGDYAAGGLKDGQPRYPGRSIASLKPKDLMMIPARVALALQSDGWWLRSDIIWAKPNPMPESVTDRPTKAHEYIFLLTKAARYYYDADAIRQPQKEASLARATRGWDGDTDRDYPNGPQSHIDKYFGKSPEEASTLPGANVRSVWTIATSGYKGAHFATFPEELVRRCVLAGSKLDDTILDPFGGSGTVGYVASGLGRNAILIDLNPEYIEMARARMPLLAACS